VVKKTTSPTVNRQQVIEILNGRSCYRLRGAKNVEKFYCWPSLIGLILTYLRLGFFQIVIVVLATTHANGWYFPSTESKKVKEQRPSPFLLLQVTSGGSPSTSCYKLQVAGELFMVVEDRGAVFFCHLNIWDAQTFPIYREKDKQSCSSNKKVTHSEAYNLPASRNL
jgi:hypothetical protein